MKEYDVIVAGGGFGGVGAAIAAAREGQHVLLIEKNGSLGGAASNCLVMPFMRYHTVLRHSNGSSEKLFLVRGIFEKIVSRMEEIGGCEDKCFNTEYLKITLDRLMAEYGVNVLFHTAIIGANTENRRITSLDLSTVAGQRKVSAKCFVDATGDGNIANLSGCEFQLGREKDNLCQPMTLCFRVVNVNRETMNQESEAMQALYKKYLTEGKLRNIRENILLFRTCIKGEIHFNSTRIVKHNPTDPFELSRAESEAREQMFELFNLLKQNFSSFKDAEIASSAAEIGVRESRMIAGEHILNGEELRATMKFTDAVAAGNYDIDIHNPEGSGTSHYYFPDGEYYTIPYRSLVAKDLDNLLIAGRCISCDHEAQASVRIMPICCATGEAAGAGAAMAAEKNCAAKDINIEVLQKSLKLNGAFIGV